MLKKFIEGFLFDLVNLPCVSIPEEGDLSYVVVYPDLELPVRAEVDRVVTTPETEVKWLPKHHDLVVSDLLL